MKKVLITGGAGYIGSHAARLFLEKDFKVVIVDSLTSSKASVIDVLKEFGDLTFYKVDLTNMSELENVFSEEKDIEACLHFAAYISVGESMKNPSKYFYNNVVGSLNLLECLRQNNISNIIFSSTAAVYGKDEYTPIDEVHPVEPLNVYGDTKLMMEKVIKWYANAYDINYIIFRYFNVCGSVSDSKLGYDKQPSEHLIPNAVKGALNISEFKLTYATVETPDGSPIRDYIDVNDLADAHYKAYNYLIDGGKSETMNLGTGKGFSVEEIIKEVEKLVGVEIPRNIGETRGGENAILTADYKKAQNLLGWKPTRALTESIESMKKWFELNPKGFRD